MIKLVKKSLFFFCCSLCLFFSGYTLAEISDHEKREYIESLAKPSKEKKVFYRWQSEQSRKILIEEGEMTPKLYNYFMDVSDGYGGSGLYVSEDLTSSSGAGGTLIQVEIEPGHKYLDLDDPEIRKKINSKLFFIVKFII